MKGFAPCCGNLSMRVAALSVWENPVLRSIKAASSSFPMSLVWRRNWASAYLQTSILKPKKPLTSYWKTSPRKSFPLGRVRKTFTQRTRIQRFWNIATVLYTFLPILSERDEASIWQDFPTLRKTPGFFYEHFYTAAVRKMNTLSTRPQTPTVKCMPIRKRDCLQF